MYEITVTAQAVVAAFCWIVIAGCAAMAVYSRRIQDTTMERLALSIVSIGALGSACRIVQQGWISDGAWFTSAGLAFYCVVVVWKHLPHPVKR